MRGLSHRKPAAGFTIIELMIATLVFSVILLVITSGVISLTDQYYKGVTSANTQSVARSVMDTVSQDIQFSDANKVTASQLNSGATLSFFCTGSHLYVYKLNFQLTDGTSLAADQSNDALVESNLPGSCPADVSAFPTSGSPRELLSPHMRLADLTVRHGGGNIWTITVRVVSGDSDMLNNFTLPASPSTSSPTVSCKSAAGSQFCAVSQLTTTVEQRL